MSQNNCSTQTVDKKRLYDKQYYQNHKEYKKAYARLYYQEHKHERRIYSRLYYQRNRENILAKQREKRMVLKQSQPKVPDFLVMTKEEKRELTRIYRKNYYKEHKSQIMIYHKKYYRANRSAILRKQKQKRARKNKSAKTSKPLSEETYAEKMKRLFG